MPRTTESIVAEVERRLCEAEKRVAFLEGWVLPSPPPADPETPSLIGQAHAAQTRMRWESFAEAVAADESGREPW